jgi:hypothetical protein
VACLDGAEQRRRRRHHRALCVLEDAGPARLAITDRGLTFATTAAQGVLITFATPVRGLEPLGLLRHPELTVTVRETSRLAALLNERRT